MCIVPSSSQPAAWDPALGLQPVTIMVILLMDLAMDEKYMYRRNACPACGLGVLWGYYRLRPGGQQAASQRDGSNVLPDAAILPNKHQLIHMNGAWTGELSPTFPGQDGGIARLLIDLRFYNRQVRNVGPQLLTQQGLGAQLIVQLTHAVGGTLYLDKHCRSRGKKGVHVSQFEVEGNDAAACFFQELEGRLLGPAQFTRRKDREM